MFRTAAVVFLRVGSVLAVAVRSDGLPVGAAAYGLAAGLLALLIGVFLFRRAKAAIAISALLGGRGLSAAVVRAERERPGDPVPRRSRGCLRPVRRAVVSRVVHPRPMTRPGRDSGFLR